MSLSPIPVCLLRGRAGGPRVTGMPEMFHTLTGSPCVANPLYTQQHTQEHTNAHGENRSATQDKCVSAIYVHIVAVQVCSGSYAHTQSEEHTHTHTHKGWPGVIPPAHGWWQEQLRLQRQTDEIFITISSNFHPHLQDNLWPACQPWRDNMLDMKRSVPAA